MRSPLPRPRRWRFAQRLLTGVCRCRGTLGIAGITLLLSLFLATGAGAQSGQEMLTIDQLHLFIMPVDDRVLVSEYYLLSNSASEAYTGDPETSVTVVFSLPEGAENVAVDEADDSVGRYEVRDDAIADTAPILPGTATTEVRFTYELPLVAGAPVRREVPLTTGSTVILLTGDRWRLTGEQLVGFGEIDAGGGTAQAYTVDPMAPGDAFTFALEGVAASDVVADNAVVASRGDGGLGLGIGILSLAVAGVAVFTLWRRPSIALPADLRDEIQALAKLDMQFEASDLDASTYQDQRRAVKARIRHRLRESRPE